MPFRPDRLKESRERKGLTQHELGLRTGMAVEQISRYEHGKVDPSVRNLETIAIQLDVTADFLIELSDDPHKRYGDTPLSDEERVILETFRHDGWPGVIHLGGERLLNKG